MLANGHVITRARLPWMFLSLALAATPVLLLFFWLLGRNETNQTDPDGTAVGVAFVLWIISSALFILAFLTLAALTWEPASWGARNARRLMLFAFGGPSVLAGLWICIFAVTYVDAFTWFSTAMGATGLFYFGVGFFALRDLFSGNASSARGSRAGYTR